ncbi:MAG: hypothetical protein K9M02_08805 [Thiohalocapsa sp.]|nr:hypothetical protein [Thiohalocapsa sp.]
MKDPQQVQGLVNVLMERFEREHLGRVLEIHRSVADGALLSDYEHGLLEDVFQEALHSHRLVSQAPEYQQLFARVVRLYRDIARQALENEERQFAGREAVRV